MTLLRGGEEAFPAMLAAISAATRSVCLETYILVADRTGWRFAEALIERARAGVSVRLIYDGIGGMSLPREYIDTLEQGGVEVIEYHPIRPWRPRFNLNLRDHRKILVVDDQVAFTGGLNISDDYAAESDGGRGWYDLHCQLSGQVVHDLARLFRRVWIREGGRPYPPSRLPSSIERVPVLARIIDNRHLRQRGKIRRAYIRAIKRAHSSIEIMNAYFLPDPGICRALRRAARRGVSVRIIVPQVSDIRVVGWAGEYLYGSLLAHGIEILGWPDRMMHAKSAVVDATWSTVGSYNLDHRSLVYNLEVVIETVDPGIGALMHAEFEAGARCCARLDLQAWQNRPIWRKCLAWLFYQLRRWL